MVWARQNPGPSCPIRNGTRVVPPPHLPSGEQGPAQLGHKGSQGREYRGGQVAGLEAWGQGRNGDP